MLLPSLTAYARLLVPTPCDKGSETALLLLAIAGTTFLLLNTATLMHGVQRTRTVALPDRVRRMDRIVTVVVAAMTVGALGLTVAFATEARWYGNGVLLNCGLKMRVGELDQAAGAGPLAVGMVLGIFALLAIGTILTRLVVRQRRLGEATQRED